MPGLDPILQATVQGHDNWRNSVAVPRYAYLVLSGARCAL